MKKYQIIRIFLFIIAAAIIGFSANNSTEIIIGLGISYLFAFNGYKTIHNLMDLGIVITAIIAFLLGEQSLLTGLGMGFLLAWIDYKVRE